MTSFNGQVNQMSNSFSSIMGGAEAVGQMMNSELTGQKQIPLSEIRDQFNEELDAATSSSPVTGDSHVNIAVKTIAGQEALRRTRDRLLGEVQAIARINNNTYRQHRKDKWTHYFLAFLIGGSLGGYLIYRMVGRSN